MKFATSLVVSALVAVGVVSAAPELQKRYDERQVYTFANSGAKTAAEACDKWRCACVNYVPKDSSLRFGYTLCRPGDTSGKNMDTEVQAYCTFVKDGQRAPVNVNKHTAANSGLTLVQ
ncbi:hypothetical protein BDZ90DRAFT_229745 [Jaminaea rosea]|uniref:Uncharacterized protein n=1 Tax=Jaminaea rosea TaxID=1569628 RepID=A0A316UZL5_9BASI|nr:hypothetical protein BDZ90DRAFT_229745 [Jaminaea rosea]PWN30747.1 hypothetical protein BDZ90DRAFT_229745 [Jaminaea rosea]